MIFRTVYEDPYPNNIMTICTYWEEEGLQLEYDEEKLYEDKEIIPQSELQEVVNTYSLDGAKFTQINDELYWPCQILHRSTDGTYVVRIQQVIYEKPVKWTINKTPRI